MSLLRPRSFKSLGITVSKFNIEPSSPVMLVILLSMLFPSTSTTTFWLTVITLVSDIRFSGLYCSIRLLYGHLSFDDRRDRKKDRRLKHPAKQQKKLLKGSFQSICVSNNHKIMHCMVRTQILVHLQLLCKSLYLGMC